MPTLLILGSSTRAAAYSARRAGWTPRCVDEFGDRDLATVAVFLRAVGDERLTAFERLSADDPEMPWIYTGPIENHPDLVEQLEGHHRLLGNTAGVLRSVRDPFQVAEFLENAGLPYAEVRLHDDSLSHDRAWLVKPLASGGGRLIEFLGDSPRPMAEPFYDQRFVDGRSISAIFVAHRGSARLAGVTRQLHGTPAGRFGYRGNIGPISLESNTAKRLTQLGVALTRGFRLMGLFGVDCILHDGQPYLVEINPRYTASVEVLELALGRSLIREHLGAYEAFQDDETVPVRPDHEPLDRVVGKEVLYAQRDVVVPALPLTVNLDHNPFSVPEIADVPWPGTCFSRGEPILTVLAEGRDEADCLAQLRERVARWNGLLHGEAESSGAGTPQP